MKMNDCFIGKNWKQVSLKVV